MIIHLCIWEFNHQSKIENREEKNEDNYMYIFLGTWNRHFSALSLNSCIHTQFCILQHKGCKTLLLSEQLHVNEII